MKNIFSIVKFVLLLNSILLIIKECIPFEKIPTPLDKILPILISISGILGLIILFVFNWLWKFPGINAILAQFFNCKINLQGTWYGILNSDYKGAEKRVVFLVISQKDAFSLDCKLLTENRVSISKTADILRENAIT
jgi:hypothetical protein